MEEGSRGPLSSRPGALSEPGGGIFLYTRKRRSSFNCGPPSRFGVASLLLLLLHHERIPSRHRHPSSARPFPRGWPSSLAFAARARKWTMAGKAPGFWHEASQQILAGGSAGKSATLAPPPSSSFSPSLRASMESLLPLLPVRSRRFFAKFCPSVQDKKQPPTTALSSSSSRRFPGLSPPPQGHRLSRLTLSR